jgi:membrane protease YdiL (CAAX protease family)
VQILGRSICGAEATEHRDSQRFLSHFSEIPLYFVEVVEKFSIPGGASTFDDSPARSAPPDPGRRFQSAVEVMLCTDLLATLVLQGAFYLLGYKPQLILHSSSLLAIFVICNSVFVLATIALILRYREESWRMLTGIDFQWQRELLIALGMIPALFLATTLAGLFFRKFFPELVTEQNPILSLIKTRRDVFWFLLMVSLSGGLKEEVQRAFVLRRFEKYLGGVYTGLALFTLYFGAAHYLQGWDNAVGAGLLGLLFGAAYIWRQNLLVPLAAHTAYNWIVIFAYWFFGLK